MPPITTIDIIDSHTGGEPTRTIIAGGPELGGGSMRQRCDVFRQRFDHIRTAVVCEPRGSDVLVGALLCPPVDPSCAAGVIFFNNTGYLNMCGHGTIGLAATLAHVRRIAPGEHKIETPVGIVTVTLHDAHRVTIENVPSYRHAKDVTVDVHGHGPVTGDIAWGGNWFFLCGKHGQTLDVSRCDELTDFTWRIRQALEREGVTGRDGGVIDHIELFGPPSDPATADSRNFVLCPGKAYDRSPCGTGTSAKIACLIADGRLREGDIWRQESIIGSIFQATARLAAGVIHPRITGTAYITAQSQLILNPDDPFVMGIASKTPVLDSDT